MLRRPFAHGLSRLFGLEHRVQINSPRQKDGKGKKLAALSPQRAFRIALCSTVVFLGGLLGALSQAEEMNDGLSLFRAADIALFPLPFAYSHPSRRAMPAKGHNSFCLSGIKIRLGKCLDHTRDPNACRPGRLGPARWRRCTQLGSWDAVPRFELEHNGTQGCRESARQKEKGCRDVLTSAFCVWSLARCSAVRPSIAKGLAWTKLIPAFLSGVVAARQTRDWAAGPMRGVCGCWSCVLRERSMAERDILIWLRRLIWLWLKKERWRDNPFYRRLGSGSYDRANEQRAVLLAPSYQPVSVIAAICKTQSKRPCMRRALNNCAITS